MANYLDLFFTGKGVSGWHRTVRLQRKGANYLDPFLTGKNKSTRLVLLCTNSNEYRLTTLIRSLLVKVNPSCVVLYEYKVDRAKSLDLFLTDKG